MPHFLFKKDRGGKRKRVWVKPTECSASRGKHQFLVMTKSHLYTKRNLGEVGVIPPVQAHRLPENMGRKDLKDGGGVESHYSFLFIQKDVQMNNVLVNLFNVWRGQTIKGERDSPPKI